MIRVENLHKTYKTGFFRKSTPAVRGINLRVNKGEIFGFIGPNGAGKSTTIKILLGLISAGDGEVRIGGGPPGKPASRMSVGYLPEVPYFYDYLTGYEFLNLMGVLSGVKRDELPLRISDTAARTGVETSWLKRKLRTYSKGMVQRAGFAQAIIASPKLLILDEPMSGLDPMGRKQIRELICSLRDEGATIFYSSHVLSDVEMICDRVALIINGKIRRQGSLEEVTGEEENLEQVLTREVHRPEL